MASATITRSHNTAVPEPCTTVAPQAIVILVAGMTAAWFAADSTGLLGHALQHAITWSALSVAIVAASPRNTTFGTWAILAGGAILGLLLTASTVPTVNVLAVAIVLAAIAQVSRGLTGRVVLIAALAAVALALSRFACDSIPTVWLAADVKGWMLGRIAGWLAGSSAGSRRNFRRARLSDRYGGDLHRLARLYAAAAPPTGDVGCRGNHRWPFRISGRACLFRQVARGSAQRGLAAGIRHQQRRHLDLEQWLANADPVERALAGGNHRRHDRRRDVSLDSLAAGR